MEQFIGAEPLSQAYRVLAPVDRDDSSPIQTSDQQMKAVGAQVEHGADRFGILTHMRIFTGFMAIADIKLS